MEFERLTPWFYCSVETPVLEECPKWKALGEIIAEIREHNDTSPDPGRVLIAAEDDRTCSQIREVTPNYT